MFRIPYKWRRNEGVKSGIPKLRACHYKLDCFAENCFIRMEPLPAYGLNQELREEKIIVSLTSYPARIDKAYYAIKSLMLQTCLADEIVLWLAENQFPGKKLPKKIGYLVKRGLSIRWCEDLRSHKKYYYALQEQKHNQVVITYDDDIIYEADSIEKLIRCHMFYPDCIICNRAHEIVCGEKGIIEPYKKWLVHSAEGTLEPSLHLLPSTGNGCLYPYGCMPKITFNWNLAKQNALTADDIWMRFCSLQNGIKVLRTKETIAILCNVWGSQKEKLTKINDIEGENQNVIDRLLKVFPNTLKESKLI